MDINRPVSPMTQPSWIMQGYLTGSSQHGPHQHDGRAHHRYIFLRQPAPADYRRIDAYLILSRSTKQPMLWSSRHLYSTSAMRGQFFSTLIPGIKCRCRDRQRRVLEPWIVTSPVQGRVSADIKWASNVHLPGFFKTGNCSVPSQFLSKLIPNCLWR